MSERVKRNIDSPLNVLIFAHALQQRGMERSLIRLLRHWDRAALSPTLVLASGAQGRFLRDVPADVAVHDLGLGRRGTSRGLIALQRLVSSIQPDCVLGVHTAPSRVALLLRVMRPRLPVIAWEGDPFSRIESAKGNLTIRRTVTAITHRLASAIICTTEDVADELRRYLWMKRTKLFIIPHPCVDDELFLGMKQEVEEPPFAPPSGQPIVVSVGNLHAHKAQHVLLEAFAILRREIPARLVLIGDGPMRQSLIQLQHALGLSESVFFYGYQDNPYKFLARSDLFVSSSESEGFDIAQVEAMACGVPVIVTDVPRFKIVVDGETGLLVPPHRPMELATAMKRVLGSPSFAQKLQRAGLASSKPLEARKIADTFAEVIQRTVSGPS